MQGIVPLRDILRSVRGHPLVVAHRGLWGLAPENSLDAVRASQRFDMVEVDVRLSADGTPFLMHDPTLARMTEATAESSSLNDGELFELTLREGAGGDGAAMTDQRVPSLIAALEAAPGIYFDLDVKREEDLDTVASILDGRPERDRCMLKRTVVGPDDIAAIRTLERRYGVTVIAKIELRTARNLDLVRAAHAAGIAGAEIWFGSLGLLSEAIAIGIAVTTYTLDDVHCEGLSDTRALGDPARVWGVLRDFGVRAIMSDHAPELHRYLNRRECLIG